MKKFFSLIALVGVFAACNPEQIQTAFKVAGAKLTVNVQVVDLGGTEYADATITSTAGTVSGKTITFEAAENTAIPAQDITVTASTPKLPKTYSQTVSVPEIVAGGVGNITVRMVIGEKLEEYTYSTAPKGSPKKTLWAVEFLDNKDYDVYEHYHPHEDIEINEWYLNDSEYLLTGKLDYKMWFKSTILLGSKKYNYEEFKPIVDLAADAFEEEIDLGEGTLNFFVSGYGMWNAWQKAYLTEQTFEVIATKGSEKIICGEFTVAAEDTQVAEEAELGMPTHLVGHTVTEHMSTHTTYHTVIYHGHDEHGNPHEYDHTYDHTYTHEYEIVYPIYSHYLYGHGVAGGNSNAGGGIIISE